MHQMMIGVLVVPVVGVAALVGVGWLAWRWQLQRDPRPSTEGST